jgi:hypothetical protein
MFGAAQRAKAPPFFPAMRPPVTGFPPSQYSTAADRLRPTDPVFLRQLAPGDSAKSEFNRFLSAAYANWCRCTSPSDATMQP